MFGFSTFPRVLTSGLAVIDSVTSYPGTFGRDEMAYVAIPGPLLSVPEPLTSAAILFGMALLVAKIRFQGKVRN